MGRRYYIHVIIHTLFMRACNRTMYSWPLAIMAAVSTAGATSVPSLTFEELTDHSELVLVGQVTRTWSDWDSEHKYIWTHHQLSVTDAAKGAPGSTVVVSELGGTVGNRSLNVAGAVVYQTGEKVMVFLQRMPNSYLRTTGWGQGKYSVDTAGRLHAEVAAHGLDIMRAQGAVAANTPLTSLNGMSVNELRSRVAARVSTQHSIQQRQGSNK
jgi:hypothetical protein